MKNYFVFFALMILWLLFGQISLQANANETRDTPADAVKSAGKTSFDSMDLKATSPKVFQSQAFEKEKIDHGKYSQNETSIDENTSRKDRPGQPGSLASWMIRPTVDLSNETPDQVWSEDQNISPIISGLNKSNKKVKDLKNITYL